MNDHFENEITKYSKKVKTKIIVNLVFFLLGIIIIIYSITTGTNEQLFDVWVIMGIMLITIILGIILLNIIKKSTTFDETLRIKEMKTMSKTYNIFVILPIILMFFIVIPTLLYETGNVVKESMEPTLEDGQMIIIKKHNLEIDRHDIVLVKIDQNEEIVKRVIGLPGDIITIKLGNVYINNSKMIEYYLTDETTTHCFLDNEYIRSECTYTLKEDEYFILGDNRLNSIDSRTFGPIKEDNILGEILNN